MPEAPEAGVPSGYTPALPITATCTSVMSQDVITTDTIPVSSTSPSPVGVFVNPYNAQTEALAAVDPGSGQVQIAHVQRNANTDAGWALVPLFGGRAVNEVNAGVKSLGGSNAFGFFVDDSGGWSSQLNSDGVTWTDPAQITTDAISNLKVAFTPLGNVVLYAASSSGDVFVATQNSAGGPFTGTVTSVGGVLTGGDFHLIMRDESNWWLAVNDDQTPTLYSGVVGETATTGSQQITQLSGALQQIALGYWNSAQNTMMYFFVNATDQSLHVFSAGGDASSPVLQQIPGTTVASATGHVSSADGTIHLYSVDTTADQNLWVLHQDPDNPWNFDGSPNFVQYLPLDNGIAAVVSDINPADAPTLFALDGADYSLRLHAQDPVTQMWASGQVLQSSPEAFEVTRFRSEVVLTDANGAPVPNYPVSLTVAQGYSAADVWVSGSTYPVGSTTTATLSSDTLGKVTVAVLTTAGMVTPTFVLGAEGLDDFTFAPAEPVHNYLASGTVTLNPTNPNGALPPFDAAGNTLTAATLPDGTTLAPGCQGNSQLAGFAASAIQQAAVVGLSTNPPGSSSTSTPAIAGFAGSFDTLQFQTFTTQDQLNQYVASQPQTMNFIDTLKRWAGDVWEAIKNGVAKVKEFFVDAYNAVVTFTLQIGEEIYEGLQIALQGLEQAAHFISGVFQAVEAAVEKVIDWLKALFDFTAIWNTKTAFEQMLGQLPAYLTQLATMAQQKADNWFQQQETAVNNYFQQQITNYGGQTFQQQPQWQTPGQPPSSSQTIGSTNTTPSDYANNVHHNWLQNKVASGAPTDSPLAPDQSMADPWQAFETNSAGALANFQSALSGFSTALKDLIEDPKQFSTYGVATLLQAVNQLLQSMLQAADGLVDVIAALTSDAMTALTNMLTTPLDIGFLNTLWDWIADAAGADPEPLTAAGLISIIAAFPVTIIYKLIEGVDNEPFPPGSSTDALAMFTTPSSGAILAGAILQIIYVVPQMISDGLAADSPWWLNLGLLGFTLVIFFLQHGLPDLTGLEWGVFAAVVGNLLWMIPAAYYVVLSVAETFLKKAKAAAGDVMAVVSSLFGAFMLSWDIVNDIVNTPATPMIVAGVLLPLPNMFAFLNMSGLNDTGYATAALVIIDFIGYVGGGVAQLTGVTGA